MKTIKKEPYCSPKLEIVSFDQKDILTISTNNGNSSAVAPGYDWNNLGWG